MHFSKSLLAALSMLAATGAAKTAVSLLQYTCPSDPTSNGVFLFAIRSNLSPRQNYMKNHFLVVTLRKFLMTAASQLRCK